MPCIQMIKYIMNRYHTPLSPLPLLSVIKLETWSTAVTDGAGSGKRFAGGSWGKTEAALKEAPWG